MIPWQMFFAGVCACDVDGDGREEIYVLNTNQAYAGLSRSVCTVTKNLISEWILKYFGKFRNSQILSITQPAAPYSSMVQLFEYGIWCSYLSDVHTQRGCACLNLAGPYSKGCTILEYGTAGWVMLKIWQFQNFPKYFRIHFRQHWVYCLVDKTLGRDEIMHDEKKKPDLPGFFLFFPLTCHINKHLFFQIVNKFYTICLKRETIFPMWTTYY